MIYFYHSGNVRARRIAANGEESHSNGLSEPVIEFFLGGAALKSQFFPELWYRGVTYTASPTDRSSSKEVYRLSAIDEQQANRAQIQGISWPGASGRGEHRAIECCRFHPRNRQSLPPRLVRFSPRKAGVPRARIGANRGWNDTGWKACKRL
jgi:hypothetical protein